MTISEAFSLYDVDILYTNGKAQKTRSNYRTSLVSFLKATDADLPVQLISYNSVIIWKQYMARNGIQPSTMASYLSRFREVLKYLKRHGYSVLDYRDIERPKIAQKAPVWLTLPEVSQFLNVIENPRDKAIFACLFSSGARISELLQLNRDSIVNGEAEIIGKGDQPGKLSFDTNCLSIVQTYLDSRSDKLKPLFISGQRRRITVSRVEQICHEYTDLAGIDKNITPHIWRHSFATDLKMNGMDIHDLSKQLRHRRLTSTQIYVHTDGRKQENYNAYHSSVPLQIIDSK